jgi:prophage antirepressor-like protein
MTEIHGDPAREIIESALAPNLSRWVSGDVANRILEALRSRGYALVPRESTMEMEVAAKDASEWVVTSTTIAAMWRAMIEATEGTAPAQSPKDGT